MSESCCNVIHKKFQTFFGYIVLNMKKVSVLVLLFRAKKRRKKIVFGCDGWAIIECCHNYITCRWMYRIFAAVVGVFVCELPNLFTVMLCSKSCLCYLSLLNFVVAFCFPWMGFDGFHKQCELIFLFVINSKYWCLFVYEWVRLNSCCCCVATTNRNECGP